MKLSLSDFRQTMQPNLYKEGLARIEHFNTISGQARERKAIILSTATIGSVSSITADLPFKFTVGPNGALYLLCYNDTAPANTPSIAIWETSGYTWTGTSAPGSFGTTADLLNAFIYYPAVSLFLGVRSSGHLWSMTAGGSYTASYKTLSGAATTYSADPIIHSKDGNLYIPADNVLYILTPAAAISAGLTLPSGFRITSVAEQEDYINIVGYDTTTRRATCYVWDRNSSLSTLTAKYDLFYDTPIANFCPGGIPIVVCRRGLTSNIGTVDNMLVVYTPKGDRMYPLHEFRVTSFGVQGILSQWTKYVDENMLFFPANIKLPGDSAGKNVIMGVDADGRVQIALNLGVNSGTNVMTGVLKQSDGFWVAAGSDGAWNTKTYFSTTAAFETTILRAKNAAQNLNFKGAIIECEPLPDGSTITVYARKNEETTWTQLKQFSTANGVKFDLDEMTAKAALAGLDRAKRVQFRVEAVGTGSVTTEVAITNAEFTLEEISNQSHK